MKLLVLDGNSIINRAFYGIKLLTTRDGHFTNGIVGFMNILQNLISVVSPDGVAAAFDLKAPTFRHKMYDGYKAGRKGMPPELAEQMPVMKDILRMMGYKVLECEGYEADDILGTLARAARESGNECCIATGDRDSLQLVGDGVSVMLASTRMGKPEIINYTPDLIAEKYGGLAPRQLIDVKALMGDSSDNIPGVAGIGEKTAVALISRFGSLDGVYENIESEDIKSGVRSKLAADKDNAYLSRTLGTICTEAPVPTDYNQYKPAERDDAQLAQTLARLEMFKMMERLGISAAPQQISFDTDENQLPAVKKCALSEISADMVDLLFDGDTAFIGDGGRVAVTDKSTALSFINGRQVRTSDSKALFHLCPDAQVSFDSMLAAYLLNPSSGDYSPNRLIAEYAVGAPPAESEDIQCAASFSALCDALDRRINEAGQSSLLHDIEIPLARVLADMEQVGFAVDAAAIAAYGEKLEKQVNRLKEEIYELVGYEFNLNSPKQLGEALFVKLGLPSGKKTKSGYSTGAEVLEGLRDKHPAVDKLLEYRTLAKLKSTYCDGLLKAVGEDGRIHSTLNQTETRTGRISSTEPNLQNIPVRTEVGREFRRFFIAPPGRTLCDADYSQIELRVLAHISGDEAMTDAFNNGADIHTITAAKVFGLPQNMVPPAMRSRAKAVNFGIVYGIGAFSLSKDINVSFAEAKRFISDYLNTFGGVKRYMEQVVEKAKKDGYVETAFGRRRYLPELSASNASVRAFGERVARNAPIQGTAADIIKIAMIRVSDRLRKEKLDARLVLQIHDELIVEASDADAPRAAEIISQEMENACKLNVPMPADVHTGKTWFDAK